MTRAVSDSQDLRASCEREIFSLHVFFERWFIGDLPADKAAFARLSDALSEAFRYILPAGRLLRRKQVLEGLFEAHGSHRDARIEIRNLVFPTAPNGDLALVFFEEHQWLDGAYDARFNTALMQRKLAAPEGVEWLHLHETTQAAPVIPPGEL